uniref:Uncharacterized protein n=1 Tax=Anguilla anguilla TaxID=7936 RepID=A0A0E9WFQ3_ANGAN
MGSVQMFGLKSQSQDISRWQEKKFLSSILIGLCTAHGMLMANQNTRNR